ncbi:putative DNA-binding domain-containing protein [Porticoccus sp. W117]|uniref:HvfC family RiPP maturation protein n=1 Tax=Porticoccus sp. W117 TaxID=3054777 RepID=UPI0025920226|nr:putative DNA-binding domain-containing protein [Porticoccus sp. W117]MDM3870173.1 putative DNA-binding domain-containing protein [Porticoccus sp. W117]
MNQGSFKTGEASFQDSQFAFAAHLRDPEHNPAPENIEDRRMGIYRELIYNNIENFIASGFPVLKTLYSEADWHSMVRDFVSRHQSTTPYFLEISQEFLRYLQEEHKAQPCDPPFLLELAHYEWVELALDVSPESLPPEEEISDSDLLQQHPQVSPLAWRLSYQYPVHQLGPENQPQEPPEQPTFLVVYRNRKERVRFMEANAVTVRLLQLLEDDATLSGQQALQQIAQELNHPQPEQVVSSGAQLLRKLADLSIICGSSQ